MLFFCVHVFNASLLRRGKLPKNFPLEKAFARKYASDERVGPKHADDADNAGDADDADT